MEPLKRPNEIGKGFDHCQVCNMPNNQLKTLSFVQQDKEDKLVHAIRSICPDCSHRLALVFWIWRDVCN